MRRKNAIFRGINLTSTVLFLVLSSNVFALELTDSAASEEFSAAKPIVDRISMAADAEELRMALGPIRQALSGTAIPPPPKDAELLSHVDPKFTSFGDEAVPLRIRLIEFLRQDAVRVNTVMQKFGEDSVACQVYARFLPSELADAKFRKEHIEAIPCVRRVVNIYLSLVQKTGSETKDKIPQLKLPPGAVAWFHRYFVDREKAWNEEFSNVGLVYSRSLDALRAYLIFYDTHSSDYQLVDGKIEFASQAAYDEAVALTNSLSASLAWPPKP